MKPRSRSPRRWLRWAARVAGIVAVAYVLLLVYPQPLFAYELRHAGIVVHATRPIPDAMRATLDRVRARLDRTPLYDPSPSVGGHRHADYVARDINLSEALGGFKAGVKDLDPARSGLYIRYHLMAAYLVEQQGIDPRDLLQHPQRGESIERVLAALPAW